jgi:hypothetical protein
MKKNMGKIDRAVRLIGGPILVLLAILVIKSTVWSWIAGVIGVIWFITGLVSRCPAYLPFGRGTRKSEEKTT